MDVNEFLEYLGRHRSTKRWATVFSEAIAAEKSKARGVAAHVARAR